MAGIEKIYILTLNLSEMETLLIGLDGLKTTGFKSDVMDDMKEKFEKGL